MDDRQLLAWRQAVLRYPDREIDHVVSLVGGSAPSELDLPAWESPLWSDRFRLQGDDGRVAVYTFAARVHRQA